MHSFEGRCRCGQITLNFTTAQEPAAITPRACDCSFCQARGAAYVSDPAGGLLIRVATSDGLHRHHNGANLADFLLCNQCDTLMAVSFERDGHCYGAVNAPVLQEFPSFAKAVVVSPQQLSADEKVARWLQVWVPEVQLITAPA